MSFDQQSTSDLITLNNEVYTDPLGLGYRPEDTDNVLDTINTPENNTGGETAPEQFNSLLALQEIVPADLNITGEFTGGERDWTLSTMTRPFEDDLDSIRDKFIATLPSGSASVLNIEARTEAISRGEVIFGRYTEITRDDWLAAKNPPSARRR